MIKNNDEWFENPLDKMPVAIDGINKYHPNGEPPDWEDTAPCEYEPPDDWFGVEKPDESDEIEEEKTMHQKMYEIATARYNPFSIGGSENCDSDISCEVQKHSPWPGGSEGFQGGSENASRS